MKSKDTVKYYSVELQTTLVDPTETQAIFNESNIVSQNVPEFNRTLDGSTDQTEH